MTVELTRILPPGGRTTPGAIARELDFGAHAPPERPYLALNMASTADGKVVIDGRSGGIGGEADRALFRALRTRTDAVMAGAGTVRAERYGRLIRDHERRAERRRAGLASDPVAIVVSASLSLTADLPLLAAEGQRVIVLTAAEGEVPGAAADVTYLRGEADDGRLRLAPLLRRLREEHGIRSILCEGGPTLNADLLAEGLVDELFLTLAPKLVGGADALTAVAGAPLDQPAELDLAWAYADDEGSLYLRYRVRP